MLLIWIFLPCIAACLSLITRHTSNSKWLFIYVTTCLFGSSFFLPILEESSHLYTLGTLIIHIKITQTASIFLIFTTFIFWLIAVREWSSNWPRLFFSLLLWIQFGVLLFFCARDLLSFYIGFECTSIPAFFLIYLFGSDQKEKSASIMAIASFIGSAILLLGICYLYTVYHTTLFSLIMNTPWPGSPSTHNGVLFLIITALFIKTPIWPGHFWLPNAHTGAPTSGSIILASVLIKTGGYALIVFLTLIPPNSSLIYTVLFLSGLISCIMGASMAFAQLDLKKIIAYSSIVHMGYCVIGISTGKMGQDGALFHMITHGLISFGLFTMGSLIQTLYAHRDVTRLGGLVTYAPILTIFLFIVLLSNAAIPGTAGFVGEFLILSSVFKGGIIPGISVAVAMTLSVFYTFRIIHTCIWGPNPNPQMSVKGAIPVVEWGILCALSGIMMILGIKPMIILRYFTQDFF